MVLAARIFALFIGIVVVFQLALAGGAPWGHLAMGGRFPGRFPPLIRVLCLVQIGILGGLAAIVLSRAGVWLPAWQALSAKLIWGVVAFTGVSLAANIATPSRGERMLWAPVVLVLLATSLVVALG